MISEAAENDLVLERLKWLITEQDVRPEDILILANRRQRIESLAGRLQQEEVAWLPELHIAFREKEQIIGQRSTEREHGKGTGTILFGTGAAVRVADFCARDLGGVAAGIW